MLVNNLIPMACGSLRMACGSLRLRGKGKGKGEGKGIGKVYSTQNCIKDY